MLPELNLLFSFFFYFYSHFPIFMSFNKICVLGLGYIGLPTASLFASKGIKVLGVDVNPDIVASVIGARLHFDETNLEETFLSAVETGNLRASGHPETSDAFMICVPTPLLESSDGGRHADLSFVDAAVSSSPLC